jgi:hypothetical protein
MRVERVVTKHGQSHVYLFIPPTSPLFAVPHLCSSRLPPTTLCPFTHSSFQLDMPPKPVSTASKAPATASKAPAKTTEKSAKGGKKTAKPAPAPADGEVKKKRRKVRKETYSSYIYKGTRLTHHGNITRLRCLSSSPEAGAP